MSSPQQAPPAPPADAPQLLLPETSIGPPPEDVSYPIAPPTSPRPTAPTMWDVVLPLADSHQATSQVGLGFDVLDFRERCQGNMGQDIGIDVLLVSNIHATGQLFRWNAQHSETAVREGDRILEINGMNTQEAMHKYIRQPSGDCLHTLRVARLAPYFEVRLERSARSLGLGLRKLRNASSILVTEVVPDGLVAQHNSSLMSSQHWEQLILCEMLVCGVNGIENNVDKMMQEFSSSKDVELKIQRMCPMALLSPSPSPRSKTAKSATAPFELPTAGSETMRVWDVIFPRGTPQSAKDVGLGFSMTDFKAKCLRESAIHLSKEVLLVSDVCAWGQVSTWNAKQSEAEVREGDCIMQVNGLSTLEEMRHRLLYSKETLHIRMARPSPTFDVKLVKNGPALGLRLNKSDGLGPALLQIHEAPSQGIAAEYNSAQASAGNWELLVLPHMAVSAVNGVSGNTDKMLELLASSQEVELKIERCPPERPAAAKKQESADIQPDAQISKVPESGSAPSSSSQADLTIWEVVLAAQNPGGSLGCLFRDHRAKCKKVLDIDIGLDVISILQLKPKGRLASWNIQRPDAEVREGDVILAVNGASTAEGMQAAMQQFNGTSPMTLQVGRPAWSFEARLKRDGRPLGLGFRNPRGSPAQHLFVTDVLSDGAVAVYNKTQQVAGRWDRLVLPEMVVAAVNGIEGDFDSMVKALSVSAVVDLQVQRSSTPATSQPLAWEVVLAPDPTATATRQSGIGLEALNFGEECKQKLGLRTGTDILLVSRIDPSGVLAAWNSQRPDAKVLQGDRVLAVNSAKGAQEMLAALQSFPLSPMRLHIVRPPWYFTARLERGEVPLGLGFKQLRTASTQKLLITEVLPTGTVAKYNELQVAAGSWDTLILPGMLIKAVNGREGDVDLMLKALSTAGMIDVQLQRAGPSLSAPPASSINAVSSNRPQAPQLPVPSQPAPPTNSLAATLEDY